jgi:hypothetical protein
LRPSSSAIWTAHHPQRQAVFDRRILADAADEGRIIANALDRGHVAAVFLLIDQHHAGRLAQDGARLGG